MMRPCPTARSQPERPLARGPAGRARAPRSRAASETGAGESGLGHPRHRREYAADDRASIGPMVPDPPGPPKTSLARPQPRRSAWSIRALAPDGTIRWTNRVAGRSCGRPAIDRCRVGTVRWTNLVAVPPCRALGHRTVPPGHQPCAHDQAGRPSRSAGPRPPGQPTRRALRSCVPDRARRHVPNAADVLRGSRRPCHRARSRKGSSARRAPRPRRR